MKASTWAGATLAVAVCAGIVGWQFQSEATTGSGGLAVATTQVAAAPVVRIAGLPTREHPQPFAIDARLMRAAVRAGILDVALPDGRTQRIAIERHYTDETGHWNVLGSAPTRFGKGPMVLTFGAAAVFGLVPMPDGTSLHVETGPRNRITVIPDGSWLPRTLRDPKLAQDAVLPPSHESGVPTPGSQAIAPIVAAVAPRAATAPHTSTMRRMAMAAPTPVQLLVTAGYTQEQVTLRGSVSAVYAELASMVAIANRAHADSGSRVQFSLGDRLLMSESLPAPLQNKWMLDYLKTDYRTQALRDKRAHFNVVLQPHQPGDNCGAAFLPTTPHGRNQLRMEDFYSVVNTDGECSPLTFAHETGHNLGGMHDRESETRADGRLNQGAYLDAYGHRTADFATIMAVPGGRTYLPYFSNADSTLCGAPCGVADYADEAHRFDAMAAAVKPMWGNGDMFVGIPDVEGVEPYNGATLLPIEIRDMSPASIGGVPMRLDVVGGSATEGVDFELVTPEVTIPQGARSVTAWVRLLPEDGDVGDEDIHLQITSLSGFPLFFDMDSTITIVQPQRHVVTGKVVFPKGVPVQTTPIDLEVFNADDAPQGAHLTVSPPEFAFQMVVPHGAQVEIGEMTRPYWLGDEKPFVPEVREDTSIALRPRMAYRISGQVRFPQGMPTVVGFWMSYWHYDGSRYAFGNYTFPQDDLHYSVTVPWGEDAEVNVNLAWAGFGMYRADFWNVAGDVQHDIVLSTLPTLRAVEDVRWPTFWGGVPVLLDGPAPPGGVTFRCTTSDGTATAAAGDYEPMSATMTIPEGASDVFLCGNLKTWQRSQFANRRLYFTIDQVTGANLTTARAPIEILVKPKKTGGPGQRFTHAP